MRIFSTLLLCLIASLAHGATWFVDSGASGANNGTSWANAWTSIGAISGVAAGDTVYISGGASGGTRNYSLQDWIPISGSSSAKITYQIGQDSAHNGTAIFIGSGGHFFYGSPGPNNVSFIGDAGDGNMHFQLTNYTEVLGWPTGGATDCSNFRFGYVNLGAFNVGLDCFVLNNASKIEIDHIYCVNTGMTSDKWFMCNWFQGTTWDDSRFHDIVLYTPETTGNLGQGADGIDFNGGGVTASNNTIIGYATNYTAAQHTDGFQIFEGSYTKICNNTLINIGDSGIYFECTGNFGNQWQSNDLVFNNVVINSGFGIAFEAESGGTHIFYNCVIANNVIDTCNGTLFNPNSSSSSTWIGCLCANNTGVNSLLTLQGGGANVGTVASFGNQLGLSTANANNDFVRYIQASPNSDFHLTSSATPLIGQGTNLSSLFTFDKDNKLRIPSGAWDLGPYLFSQGTANTNPVILVTPPSLNFGYVLTNTSSTNYFTVQNVGQGTLTGVASIGSPFSFLGFGQVAYSLTAGQSHTIGVVFEPSLVRNYSVTATFTGGGGATNPISGTGQQAFPVGIIFVATNGNVLSPFLTTTGAVYMSSEIDAPASSGQAYYWINIPMTGNYEVNGYIQAPDTAHNSLYINFDSFPTEPTNVWDVVTNAAFAWSLANNRGNGTPDADQFNPMIWNLSAGYHQFIVGGREANTYLGAWQVISAIAQAPPNGLRIVRVTP